MPELLYARIYPSAADQTELSFPLFENNKKINPELKIPVNENGIFNFVTHLNVSSKELAERGFFGLRKDVALQMEYESLFMIKESRTTCICALSVSKEVYDKVQTAKNYPDKAKKNEILKSNNNALNLRQYRFTLQPDEFEVIGFVVQDEQNKETFHIIENELREADELSEIFKFDYQTTLRRDLKFGAIQSTYYFIQDIESLKKIKEQQKLDEIINSIETINLPESNYLLGTLYNDTEFRIFNPELALYYFEKCDNYLPALKATLPIYISAILDDDGKIKNPYAYALAQRVAENIIKQEPDNLEAKAFLECEKFFGKSIKISKEFKTILGQPLKSMRFFSDITKQMHQTVLFNRKSETNEKYAQDRANAQHEWDTHYALVRITI